jgi:stearoyl-CoA desaturase (Delta-9 desaturase)
VSRLPPPVSAEAPRDLQVPVSAAARVGILAAIILPFAGFVAAVASLWGWGFGWTDFGLLVGMYLLTAVGITVGFHRLFTHRSFETNGVVRFVLAALGSMAVQGSVLRWVAQHRRHHQHSDTDQDPHSPHHGGRGLLGRVRGFVHAHVGWAFRSDPVGLDRYVADLRKSAAVRVASALFPLWIVVGLVLPAVVGGLVSGTWAGALFGLVWGGLVRLFLVHHVTWSVNSAGHLWGSRPFKSSDHSRDNYVLGVLALGEGWHNTHHAFPTSARHGLRWYQPDLSYYLIRLLSLLGLAWNVRLPSREAQVSARQGA